MVSDESGRLDSSGLVIRWYVSADDCGESCCVSIHEENRINGETHCGQRRTNIKMDKVRCREMFQRTLSAREAGLRLLHDMVQRFPHCMVAELTVTATKR
mmetsp:Transcript_4470/g.7554  ORF Transcript_4470/g.7554 Transcript_4470/m.7554 type:complete len:100 (+) Transcript_4470:733-1032(+)